MIMLIEDIILKLPHKKYMANGSLHNLIAHDQNDLHSSINLCMVLYNFKVMMPFLVLLFFIINQVAHSIK